MSHNFQFVNQLEENEANGNNLSLICLILLLLPETDAIQKNPELCLDIPMGEILQLPIYLRI